MNTLIQPKHTSLVPSTSLDNSK
ncbi:hypothetical protein F383_29044 [Gossypium arboreum]|uniref:Uncharacterized protein n=1 Tax=Gossypium arboreum TaxID=29729 RepID=A0A0B0MV35_GOSAR|nr:hypothetical protein F383_29044 [Gossypium arboreum]